jgi:hypothetical protein
MAMTMNDHMQYTNMLSYSHTARDAVGIRSDYMRDDKYWLHTATYNRLLKRWNESDAQTNLFLLAGLGTAQHGDDSNLAATFGMEADWETRRFYALYENRYIEAGDVDRAFMQKVRVGVAPYIGGYDDVHTWLMLQVDHHPSLRDNVVVTPFVRAFNQELMGELGISNKKDIMVNATYQF